jgi:hypothetical protein
MGSFPEKIEENRIRDEPTTTAPEKDELVGVAATKTRNIERGVVATLLTLHRRRLYRIGGSGVHLLAIFPGFFIRASSPPVFRPAARQLLMARYTCCARVAFGLGLDRSGCEWNGILRLLKRRPYFTNIPELAAPGSRC